MARRRPYAEAIALLDTLPEALRDARKRRGMGLRQVADDSGVGFATIWRIERGEGCSVPTAVSLMRWLEGGK